MQTNQEVRAQFIEVRFSDGKILRATDDHADEVWGWFMNCETITFVHGGKYVGKPMETVASHLQPEAPADGYYKVVAGVMTKFSGADEGVFFNAEGPISPTNDKFDPTSGDREG